MGAQKGTGKFAKLVLGVFVSFIAYGYIQVRCCGVLGAPPPLVLDRFVTVDLTYIRHSGTTHAQELLFRTKGLKQFGWWVACTRPSCARHGVAGLMPPAQTVSMATAFLVPAGCFVS